MLVVYGVYCIVLHFNPALERWAQTLPVPFKKVLPNEQSGLVSYKNLENDAKAKHTNYGMESNSAEPAPEEAQWSPGNEWSPEHRNPSNLTDNPQRVASTASPDCSFP